MIFTCGKENIVGFGGDGLSPSGLGAEVKILPLAKYLVGIFPFADVFHASIHRKWPDLIDIMLDHRVGSEFFDLISIPVNDLRKRSAIALADVLFRIADRNSPDRTEKWRISQHRRKLFVGFFFAASRQPCRGQAAGGDGELNVLDHRAERSEEDTLIVLAVFPLPFRARRLRETGLEPRISQHHKDRDRVGKIGFLDGGKAFGVIDQPLRLTQKYIQHRLLRVGFVDDDQVPALGIGPGRTPPPGFGNAQQCFALDPLSLLKSPDAAALLEHLKEFFIASVVCGTLAAHFHPPYDFLFSYRPAGPAGRKEFSSRSCRAWPGSWRCIRSRWEAVARQATIRKLSARPRSVFRRRGRAGSSPGGASSAAAPHP